jgi:hypothetical protein
LQSRQERLQRFEAVYEVLATSQGPPSCLPPRKSSSQMGHLLAETTKMVCLLLTIFCFRDIQVANARTTLEICKVCKTSRYLNPNMRFLVNPECYHRMCESCVDQIFSQGPRPCPIVGCRKTLRRNRFRTQTFEDLAVEREVDIRAHVASMYVTIDFPSIRA